MDFFPTDREFVVELRFRQPNEETAVKIMNSMMRQTDLLQDVYVEKVHCAAHSYKQMCSEDLLDGVAESYAKVTEAFNTFNSEVSSLINKDWNERAKQYMRVITGTARGKKLKTLESLDIRPTSDMVKEAIFSIHDNLSRMCIKVNDEYITSNCSSNPKDIKSPQISLTF